MSVRNVKAFYEKVEEDKALQAKLKVLVKKAEEDVNSGIDELIEIAKAEGFVFTRQQFADVRNEQLKTPIKVDLQVQAEGAIGPGIGCQPGTGLYIHVDPPPPPPPHHLHHPLPTLVYKEGINRMSCAPPHAQTWYPNEHGGTVYTVD